VALGGVAVAAVPGSPLRAWIGRGRRPPPRRERPRREAPAPARAPAARAGVSILPTTARCAWCCNGAAPGCACTPAWATASWWRSPRWRPAASARFRTSPGRIEVVGAGAGEVRIALPRGASAAEVEVDGLVYIAKEGGRLRAVSPARARRARGGRVPRDRAEALDAPAPRACPRGRSAPADTVPGLGTVRGVVQSDPSGRPVAQAVVEVGTPPRARHHGQRGRAT
jgi:hypothetical protein